MTRHEPPRHQPLDELLELCDDIIAHSADADLGNATRLCCERLPGVSTHEDRCLQDLLQCLELLELDRRTQRGGSSPRSSEALGTPAVSLQLGRFKIEQELGRGGFGVVYLAEDPILNRKVAIKIPRPEITASESLRARFLRESKVVARLSHPGIVQMHEAGESGVISFQVMEYCSGGSLSGILRRLSQHEEGARSLPISQAVELMVAVSAAVEHAHRHGILHRDLKPANILLQRLRSEVSCNVGSGVSNSNPATEILSQYRPVVADFGLAKLLADASDATRMQDASKIAGDRTANAGTPYYMAPEQFSDSTQPVSAATDVFGLGVILFELLAGRPLFFHSEPTATQSHIGGLVASSRSCRNLDDELSRLPKDLTAICRMATATRATDRYQTVQQMINDLQAFQRGEPIQARTWTTTEHVVRWARRRPAITSLLVLCCMLVVCLLAFGGWHLKQLTALNLQLTRTADEKRVQADAAVAASQRADRQTAVARLQTQLAEEQMWLAREREYATEMSNASEAWKAKDSQKVNEHLLQIRSIWPETQTRFEWQYLTESNRSLKTFPGPRDTIFAARYDPKSRVLVAISEDGSIRRWNTDTQELMETIDLGAKAGRYHGDIDDHCTTVVFCRSLVDEMQDEVIVWNLKQNREVLRRRYPLHDVMCSGVSSDGSLIAIGGRSHPTQEQFFPFLELWPIDPASGKSNSELDQSIRVATPQCHAVSMCDFVGNTKTLAVTTLWNAPGSWKYQLGCVNCVSIGSNSISQTAKRDFRIDSIGERREGRPFDFCVSDDGNRVAIIVDLTANRVDVTKWPSGEIELVRDFESEIPLAIKFHTSSANLAIALHANSETGWGSLVDVLDNEAIHQSELLLDWDLANNRFDRLSYPATRSIVGIRPPQDGFDNWIVAESGGTLSVWSPDGLPEDRTLSGHSPRETWTLGYSPDGRFIFSAGDDHTVRKFSTETGHLLAASETREQLLSCLDVAPDGRFLAVGGYDDVISIYDATSLQTVATLEGHTHDIRAVAYSPDGKQLATGGRDRNLRIWDLQDFSCTHELNVHKNTIRALAWTDDGQLISADGDGVVNFRRHDGTLWASHLEHDGVLSIAIASSELQLSESVEIARDLDRWNHKKDFMVSEQAADSTSTDRRPVTVGKGELVAFGMAHGAVRMLQPRTGRIWSIERPNNVEVRSLKFSSDGKTLAGGSGDGSLRFWQTSTQREVLRLDNPAAIHHIAFSPDGKALAAALHNGFIRIVDTNPLSNHTVP